MDLDISDDFKIIPIKSHVDNGKLSIKYARVFSNGELSRLYKELKVENAEKKSIIKHIKGSTFPEYMFQRLNLFKSFEIDKKIYTLTDPAVNTLTETDMTDNTGNKNVNDTWFFWINKNKSLANINLEKYIPKNALSCLIPLDDMIFKFDNLDKVKIDITQCYVFFDIVPKLTMSDEEKNFLLLTWIYS